MTLNGEIQVQDNSAQYYEKRYSGNGLLYHGFVIDGLLNYVRKKDKILDLGCGTGIIQRLYPYYNIKGIDPSSEMLKHYPSFGVCKQALAEEIPFQDGSFDVVICRSVLHHLKEPRIALREIYRVLNSGGRLIAWETNKSAIAHAVRHITQHGDRFSDYHSEFSDLPRLIAEEFFVREVKYEGFIAYPLLGFPDIIDFKVPYKLTKPLIGLDEFISKVPFLRRLSFAVRVFAKKHDIGPELYL